MYRLVYLVPPGLLALTIYPFFDQLITRVVNAIG
jgi:hypothetical protein